MPRSWASPREVFEKNTLHIHVPAGAIPKDGPSAGITMATAIVSALTGIPVRKDVAMTGEITLRGRVLPIGGLKSKILAAHLSGARMVILPRKNEKDLRDIPEEIRKQIKLVLVDTMDQVLEAALRRKPTPLPAGSAGPSPARMPSATAAARRPAAARAARRSRRPSSHPRSPEARREPAGARPMEYRDYYATLGVRATPARPTSRRPSASSRAQAPPRRQQG